MPTEELFKRALSALLEGSPDDQQHFLVDGKDYLAIGVFLTGETSTAFLFGEASMTLCFLTGKTIPTNLFEVQPVLEVILLCG